MSEKAVNGLIRKFEETGFLDVSPGRERRVTSPPIMDEVAITTAEASANSS